MVVNRVQHRKPVIRALNALRWETDVGPQGLLVAGFVLPAPLPNNARRMKNHPFEFGRTVLHVDDDPFILTMYRQEFEKKGLRVVSLTELREDVINQVREINPVLIVSDVIRPKPDGLDFLEAIRKSGHTRDLPFILLSNTLSERVIDIAQSMNVTDLIVKADQPPHRVADSVFNIIQAEVIKKNRQIEADNRPISKRKGRLTESLVAVCLALTFLAVLVSLFS